jgi:hypothetical protein
MVDNDYTIGQELGVDQQKVEEVAQEVEQVSAPIRIGIPEWLKAKSPDEPIENYINHPLNFARSTGLAQALRGATGIIGDLRYAIVDVIVGLLKFANEKRGQGNADNISV